MIAVFKPVNNPHGYDIREFEIINGKPGPYRWLAIADYKNKISDFPVFKPKVQFANNQEYLNQFIQNGEGIKQINLF